MRARRTQAGYSLIELLVVVAVILVIAAIAIPNYFRSKMSANESTTVANLRSMTTALTIYSLTFKECGYPNTLAKLGPGSPPSNMTANLLEGGMAADTFNRTGFTYTYRLIGGVGDCSGLPGNDYELEARPMLFNRTGLRGFYVNPTLVIRFDTDGDAAANSPPL
ncbi:MAG: prepilin-type N-terminal cleavage/methylation domain-containing protein [Candidatus Acidiferrales bacterium]